MAARLPTYVRLAAALVAFAIGTLALVGWQWTARRSGLGDPRRPARLWHCMVLALIGVRVRVVGRLADARPLLIAANHVSWSDSLVLGSVAPMNFVAKAEVAAWPVLGRLFRSQATVFVARAERHRSADQARRVAEGLAGGDPLVLFAEGTTGCGNRLLPFKSTLFGAAAQLSDTDFTVQPAALVYRRLHGMATGRRERARLAWIGDQDMIPHLVDLIAAGPVEVELRFAAPLAGKAGDRKRMAARASAAVAAEIARSRRGEKA